jgi:hypothetical protein
MKTGLVCLMTLKLQTHSTLMLNRLSTALKSNKKKAKLPRTVLPRKLQNKSRQNFSHHTR